MKYVLATLAAADDYSYRKYWMPFDALAFYLNGNDIIYAMYDHTKRFPICEFDTLCDINTHERVISLDQLQARNPAELVIKLNLYGNLLLDI